MQSPPKAHSAHSIGGPVAGKRIVLCVCGGIAAYKSVELVRELTLRGADVRVAMTKSAQKFVGAITFSVLSGNEVITDLFPSTAPALIPHTHLGRWADLVVVAPATARTIAKYALGIADEIVSSILLATRAPIVMAPAMHTEMWENEATQANIKTLESRGVTLVGPEEGRLAGPDSGMGRLAEITDVITAIEEELGLRARLDGVRVLVTAGGTREPIDAVRYIGNRSSGRMGFAIATEALRRGAKVALVSGPSSLVPPADAEFVSVETAAQMQEEVASRFLEADVVIMAAAVADWRPAHRPDRNVQQLNTKLKKAEGPPVVDLEETPDILESLGKAKTKQVLVGFAAETEDLEGYAKSKLESKNLDLIVANLVGVPTSGFDVATNKALLLDRDGKIERLPLMTKRRLAIVVLDAIAKRFL